MTRDEWLDLRKQFLADNPEHQGGVVEICGESYLVDKTAVAFGEWLVSKGLVPPERLEALKRALSAALTAAHGGERN
jgi:hypothetical protein